MARNFSGVPLKRRPNCDRVIELADGYLVVAKHR